MGDYKTDADRFTDDFERGQRDLQHAENLRILASHLHVSPDEVLGILRPKPGLRRLDEDGKPIGVEFRNAPRRFTDRDLAAWAVRQISAPE